MPQIHASFSKSHLHVPGKHILILIYVYLTYTPL